MFKMMVAALMKTNNWRNQTYQISKQSWPTIVVVVVVVDFVDVGANPYIRIRPGVQLAGRGCMCCFFLLCSVVNRSSTVCVCVCLVVVWC